MKAKLLPDEDLRLLQLRSLRILDSLPEEAFSSLVEGVANLLSVPIVLLSLVDENRQWFKAKVGINICETSRDLAFCSHAILQDVPLIVEDATLDERFQDNQLVTGDFHLRFYAGAQIVVNGQRLGTLCCIDSEPRSFSDAQIKGLVAMARQVSILLEARILTDQLCKSEDLFQTAIGSMNDGLLVLDADGMILIANDRACKILGVNREKLSRKPSFHAGWKCIHDNGKPWPGKDHPAMVALRSNLPQSERIMGVHKTNGELVWIMINAVPLFHSDSPTAYGVVCTFCDITRARADKEKIALQLAQIREYSVRLEEIHEQDVKKNIQLEGLSFTDNLTGISNNRAFQSRLKDMISTCRRKNLDCSLLMVDLDSFKAVNDDFGHLVGDEVLRQAARTLSKAARSGEFVARYGGEEFVVILPGAKREEAILAGERLRKCIEKAHWEHRPVTASFGVATLEPGMGASDLVKASDDALYFSKKNGKNRVTHYQDIARKEAA